MPITVLGQAYRAGDVLPDGAVPERRLRQLYESRRLVQLAPAAPAPSQAEAQDLPAGWRDLHWRTLASMARDLTGLEAANKAQAVAVLEQFDGPQLP